MTSLPYYVLFLALILNLMGCGSHKLQAPESPKSGPGQAPTWIPYKESSAEISGDCTDPRPDNPCKMAGPIQKPPSGNQVAFSSDCVPHDTGELVDVPAIQVTREEEYGNSDWCNICGGEDGSFCTSMACDPHARHKVTVTTCKDKSRILLTDEQGVKHCVKFK